MAPLRILTFNWHEAYICLLAKTGHAFTVVDKHKGGHAGWLQGTRPVPTNVTLLPIGSEAEAVTRARRGAFDLAICHNLRDLADLKGVPISKVVVFHNMLSTETALTALAGQQAPEKKTYIGQYLSLWDEKTQAVFISEKKRADAEGIDGRVILPGIDLDEYGGYRGEIPRVLRVGNFFTGRDIMLGHSDALTVLRNLPVTVLGINSDIPGARLSSSWDDLRDQYRSHRVYLNTTIDRFEDGYNLSMLEAMATGMPVVATLNRTSPIEDGVNGYISDDAETLHRRLKALLADRELAKRLGVRARETVASAFPLSRFIEAWHRAFEEAMGSCSEFGVRSQNSGGRSGRPGTRDLQLETRNPILEPPHSALRTPHSAKRVLLSYCANPQTAAAYLERALRKDHDVVTVGPDIAGHGALVEDRIEPIWKVWNLDAVRDRARPNDIACLSFDSDALENVKLVRSDWEPDLFLWVDTAIYYQLDGMSLLSCPKAAYFIDSHNELQRHLEMARLFDIVFVAQRAYVPEFRRAGCREVHWLPLACDPDIHTKHPLPKVHDIGFVGSLTSLNPRRQALVDLLKRHFRVHVERCFLDDMARVFSQSKIVFNQCVKNDLNMRVFEALSCGSMLITDEADGLADFFEDRKHLVVYRNEKELLDLARHYLDHPEERETIAARGREEVLAKHTYSHRVRTLLSVFDSWRPASSRVVGAPSVFTGPSAPKEEPYYASSRPEILSLVPESARRILDVGCGEGVLGESLLRRGATFVAGIEKAPEAAARARTRLSHVIEGDVETLSLSFDEGSFDCIVCADVLEHLVDPWTALKKLSGLLRPDGIFVASIPNVRNIEILARMVEGRWTYERFGILDAGHLRFFAKADIEEMFEKVGFAARFAGQSVCPLFLEFKDRPFDGTIRLGRLRIEGLSLEEFRDFFVVQYLVQAGKMAPFVGTSDGSMNRADARHSAGRKQTCEAEAG